MVDTASLRGFNDRLKISLYRVIEDLTNDQLEYIASAIDERSIAEVAIHANESLLGFTLCAAGHGWPEAQNIPITVAGLLLRFNETHELIDQTLANLTEGTLEETFTLPWGQEVAAFEAIADGLAHGLIHVGAIEGIRAIGGFPTPPEIYIEE
jgi:hypothetical protein